jgi:hypothetical protein
MVGIVVVFLFAFFMVVFVRNKIFVLVSIRLTHFHRLIISLSAANNIIHCSGLLLPSLVRS